jgi:hypothetical protein
MFLERTSVRVNTRPAEETSFYLDSNMVLNSLVVFLSFPLKINILNAYSICVFVKQ